MSIVFWDPCWSSYILHCSQSPTWLVSPAIFHREKFSEGWVNCSGRAKFLALGLPDSQPCALSFVSCCSWVYDLYYVWSTFPVILSGWKQSTMFHEQQSLTAEYAQEKFCVAIKIITKLIRHIFNDMYNSYCATHH